MIEHIIKGGGVHIGERQLSKFCLITKGSKGGSIT